MIRVGMVGIGQIAEQYIKLFSEEKIEGASLAALCTRNQQRLIDLVDQYKIKHVALFAHYEEMLRSGLIDAVIITTPHYQHPEMSIQAMQHAIHTLVEKPVGVMTEDVERVNEVARNHPELIYGTLFNRRMATIYQRAKAIMDEGVIGELRRVHYQITNLYRTEAYYRSADWRGTYAGEGGGVLMNQASHQLDLMLWLTGLPETIDAHLTYGAFRPIEVESDAVMMLRYASKATGQFIASTHECPGTNRLEISGDQGTMIIEDDRKLTLYRLRQKELDHAKTCPDYFTKIDFDTEITDFLPEDNALQQAKSISNFIAAINGLERLICPGVDGLHTLRVINAAYLSDWKKETIPYAFHAHEFTAYLKEKTDIIGRIK